MQRSYMLGFIFLFLCACTPMQRTVSYEYVLNQFGTTFCHSQKHRYSLMIAKPEAATQYQTNQMFYIDKPYQLNTFAKHAWVTSPADMLHPLLIEAANRSNCFLAVSSGHGLELSDYRLDTTLLQLRQNFLTQPTTLELSLQLTLIRVKDSQVIASKLIEVKQKSNSRSPEGGVRAANLASQAATKEAMQFVSHTLHLR